MLCSLRKVKSTDICALSVSSYTVAFFALPVLRPRRDGMAKKIASERQIGSTK